MPARMRVDNGSPRGSAGDLPTELALWLFGLGVEVTWNPPLRPEDNGVIERSQGTGKRWAEPTTCADAAELQRRIDDLDEIQRAEYPCIGGKGRMEAFPGLGHSGRHYRAEDEAATWSHEAALAHLATYAVAREVDARGSISLGNRSRYVGVRFSGGRVYVSLDPHEMEWMIRDREGTCHTRLAAEELSPERITGLDVSRHRSRPARPPLSKRRKDMAEFPADHGVA
jgi:hypothetical protein